MASVSRRIRRELRYDAHGNFTTRWREIRKRRFKQARKRGQEKLKKVRGEDGNAS